MNHPSDDSQVNPFDVSVPAPQSVRVMHRSPAPKVLGWLNLGFFGLGLIGFAISIVTILSLSRIANMPEMADNPAFERMAQPGYRRAMMWLLPLSAAATISLLISGIGLLKYRRWGRTFGLVYVGCSFFNALAGFAINYRFILGPMIEQTRRDAENPAAVGGAAGGLLGGLFGIALGLAYPTLLFIFLMRRKVIDSLNGGGDSYSE